MVWHNFDINSVELLITPFTHFRWIKMVHPWMTQQDSLQMYLAVIASKNTCVNVFTCHMSQLTVKSI